MRLVRAAGLSARNKRLACLSGNYHVHFGTAAGRFRPTAAVRNIPYQQRLYELIVAWI